MNAGPGCPMICPNHGKVPPHEVYTYPNGTTKCRICGREHMARYRAKARADKAARTGRRRDDGTWLCQCGLPAVGRGSTCAACLTARNYPVPRDRIRELVVAELEQMNHDDAVVALAERCRVSEGLIRDIVNGRDVRGMRFVHGDKILTGLGLAYLWYVPAEHGGFADVYDVAA